MDILAEKAIPVPLAYHKSHMVYHATVAGPLRWKAATNHTLCGTAFNMTCNSIKTC